jgi:hypothetical protein
VIDVVDRTYRFIHMLFDENTGGEFFGLSVKGAPQVERSERWPQKPLEGNIDFQGFQ